MNDLRLNYLFDRFFHKRATPDEKKEFLALLSNPEHSEKVRELAGEAWHQFEPSEEVFSDDQSRTMLENILGKATAHSVEAPVIPSRRRPFYRRSLAAAAVFIFACTGAALYLLRTPSQKDGGITGPASSEQAAVRIVPGGERAYLTLADGSVIALDTAVNGTVTVQGNSKVMKMDDRLMYDGTTGTANMPVVYNTISTPRGGEYRITLADGTRVWLNAASSLRFPIAFTGPDRSVSLAGEAYFEVSKHTGKAFKVMLADSVEIEVMGTSFNVMAYDDEKDIKTTLAEGKVKVSRPGRSIQLLPMQQAVAARGSAELSVGPVDMEEALAWKEGRFYFNNDNILSIMRKLSRWYNVEVYYDGPVPAGHYEGAIRRQAEIGQVLEILELPGGINFEIKENRIMVRAK